MKNIRVTVCQLRNSSGLDNLESDWAGLIDHARQEGSDLVLLPEMGLAPWFASVRLFDPQVWESACSAHLAWLPRLAELAPAMVLGSRPLDLEGKRQNMAYVWDKTGEHPAHTKYFLPDEEGFWEASWYSRGDGRFEPVDVGPTRVGFMICTEMWFFEYARQYGKKGVQIIASPRCTHYATLDKWLAGGRASAVVAGAYSLSSNPGDEFSGGQGWIIDPEGRVLATTSRQQPYVTVEIDLDIADEAKQTYPRYVID